MFIFFTTCCFFCCILHSWVFYWDQPPPIPSPVEIVQYEVSQWNCSDCSVNYVRNLEVMVRIPLHYMHTKSYWELFDEIRMYLYIEDAIYYNYICGLQRHIYIVNSFIHEAECSSRCNTEAKVIFCFRVELWSRELMWNLPENWRELVAGMR